MNETKLKESFDFIDENPIPFKLLNIYDLYEFKLRSERYQRYYNNIEDADLHLQIKHDMLVHNMFLLRMIQDIGFKQYILGLLDKRLAEMDTDGFRELLFNLVEELRLFRDRNLSDFFKKEIKPVPVDFSPILDHDKEFKSTLDDIDMENLSSSMQLVRKIDEPKSIKFLQWLRDTSTIAYGKKIAEEIIYEKETNHFISMLCTREEIDNSLLLYDRFKLGFENYSDTNPIVFHEIHALLLIPQFKKCVNKVQSFLQSILEPRFKGEGERIQGYFSLVATHIVSTFTAMLFDSLPFNERTTILNRVFVFSVSLKEMEDCMEDPAIHSIEYMELLGYSGKKRVDPGFLNFTLYQDAGVIFESKHDYDIALCVAMAMHNVAFRGGFGEEEKKDRGTLLHNIGSIYWRLEQYEKAIPFFKDSIAILAVREDKTYVRLLSMMNLAVSYWMTGNKDEANGLIKKVEELDSTLNTIDKARVYYNLATRYRSMGLYFKEEMFLDKYFKAIDAIDRDIKERFFKPVIKIAKKRRTILKKNKSQTKKGARLRFDRKELMRIDEQEDHLLYRNKTLECLRYLNPKRARYFLIKSYEKIKKDVQYYVEKCMISYMLDDVEALERDIGELSTHHPNALYMPYFGFVYRLQTGNLLESINQMYRLYEHIMLNDLEESGVHAEFLLKKAIHYFAMKAHERGNENHFDKLVEILGGFNLDIHAKYDLVMFIGDQLELAGEVKPSKTLFDFGALLKPLEGNAFLGVWFLRHGQPANAIARFRVTNERAVSNDDKLSSVIMLARAYAMDSQYKEAEQAVENGLLLIENLKDFTRKDELIALKESIRLFRDKRIRYESINNKDAVLTLKTAYQFLQYFKIGEECDFTPIVLQISKGLEITLHDKLGKNIKTRLLSDFRKLLNEQSLNAGPTKLNPLVFKFIFYDDQLTLGNWLYFTEKIINKKAEKNAVQAAIISIIEDLTKERSDIIEKISAVAEHINPERGSYVHKEILTKENLDAFLTKTTALINELIYSLDIF